MVFAGGYNRNAVRMILGEVGRVHGLAAVKQRFRDLDPEDHFELDPDRD